MSGIYISGMEMPTRTVHFCIHPDGKVFATFDGGWKEYKATEVPPHGRLIDADAFERLECNGCGGACEALLCDCTNCDAECRCDFMLDIHAAPTIIPAEEGEK